MGIIIGRLDNDSNFRLLTARDSRIRTGVACFRSLVVAKWNSRSQAMWRMCRAAVAAGWHLSFCTGASVTSVCRCGRLRPRWPASVPDMRLSCPGRSRDRTPLST
jgi:hypothetical protein